jgi:hypothetical protein
VLLDSPFWDPDQRNWIVITTDRDNLTWTNSTLAGHYFHPGRVVNSLVRGELGWYVRSVGTGVTPHYIQDDWLGEGAFQAMQQRVAQEIFGGFNPFNPLVNVGGLAGGILDVAMVNQCR